MTAAAKKKAAAKKPPANPGYEISKADPDVVKAAAEETNVIDWPNVSPFKPGDVAPRLNLHNSWATIAPGEMDPSTLENPKYWSFLKGRFTEGDDIRVTADNMSWIAEGYVVRGPAGDLMVKLIDIHEFQPPAEQYIDVGQYRIANRGAQKKYVVIDRNTGKELKTMLPTQIAALTYATEQQQASRR